MVSECENGNDLGLLNMKMCENKNDIHIGGDGKTRQDASKIQNLAGYLTLYESSKKLVQL